MLEQMLQQMLEEKTVGTENFGLGAYNTAQPNAYRAPWHLYGESGAASWMVAKLQIF